MKKIILVLGLLVSSIGIQGKDNPPPCSPPNCKTIGVPCTPDPCTPGPSKIKGYNVLDNEKFR